jgi:hypothetical protein
MAIPPLRLRSMPMPPQTSSSLLLVTIGDGLFNYFLSLKGEKACGSQKIGQYPPVLLVLLLSCSHNSAAGGGRRRHGSWVWVWWKTRILSALEAVQRYIIVLNT